MAEQEVKKRIRKWPFIILFILVALGAIAWYFYQHYIAGDKWKPLLQAQLKELVANSTDSLYRIEYSDFDLNLSSGNATLKDFKLIPDTSVYNKLVANKKAPDNLFTLSVEKLHIKNVGAKKAYQEKILEIDDIIIDKPSLTIVNKRLPFNDTVKIGKPKTPYQIIKKVFKRLRIDSIALNDISLTYINKSSSKPKQSALKHLDISISNILVDSLSAKDTSRFYYTKGVEFKLHGYEILTPDKMYLAKVKEIAFSTATRSIVLEKPALQPRYSKRDFFRKLGRTDDRFDLSFKRIAITDIDLQRFLRDQKLYAGLMDISGAKVEIYHDNAFKGKKTSKIGKDPHQQLQKLSLDMKLTKLNLRNASISYAEYDVKSGYTGVISFTNTTGAFYNVTNDAAAKAKNHFMTARINTSFMGAAPLNVNFRFNLAAKNGAFNYNGRLGKFDGRKMDMLVRPLAMVHVKSADIDRLTFNVDASNYSGKGKLEFYYHNLNVELLKKDTSGRGLVKQGFISRIANTLIIDDDNPDKKGNFRPGPINLQREPTTSFFSFLYKALLDGLKPSVGFDQKTETRVTKTVEKIGTLVNKWEQFKENRRKRREERKLKREQEKAEKEKQKAQEEKEKTKEKAPESNPD